MSYVLIIGAGISGINAGFRLQDQIPGIKYAILETRGGMGGTWDFFKYPGLRSDSDLQTFGFPWRPWSEKKSIADGQSIVNYIKETAEIHGIDKKILYHHKMLSSNWSSEQQRWRLDVDAAGEKKQFYCNYIIMSTGYYDYSEPLQTTITGLENFKGTIVHPQFWQEDLDYSDKRIVIVGSGATSVTLLPVLAKTAKHVTMLQRSPGYILNQPGEDNLGAICKMIGFPNWLTFKIVRFKYLVLPFLFFNFCRTFPNAARWILQRRTTRELPKSILHDPHFKPSYNPWEERLCVAPDGDFYASLREGKANIATGVIKGMSGNTIELQSGEKLEADILITATGLKMQFAGGSALTVDNKPITLGEKYLWKGVMLQDVPNAAYVLGYTNASWTLGADATAQHVCRMIKYMRKKNYAAVIPRLPTDREIKSVPVLNLRSTYVQKAKGVLPMAGDQKPWKPRSNYFTDLWEAKLGDITADIEFVPAKAS